MKKTVKRIIALFVALSAAFCMLSAPASAVWLKSGSRWWYQNEDGSYPKDKWEQISGKWYLFDQDGYMLTGWQSKSGVWYYLNPAGDMATGWKQIGSTWYYLDSSGAMKTGWIQLNGVWYYLLDWGGMVTGMQTIDGKEYTFADSGALVEDSSSSQTANSSDTLVYWGETGTKYHIDPYCRSFQGKAAHSGTLAEAKAAGREGWCGICSRYMTDDMIK